MMKYTEREPKKLSKAEKRRLKKEAEAKALEEEKEQIREAGAAAGPDHRELEAKGIREQLAKESLAIKDIVPDGDCMYSAIADQLKLVGLPERTAEELRSDCVKELLTRKNEYMPFMLKENGDVMDDEGYGEYCQRVQGTKQWGGDVELKALSKHFRVKIEVYQYGGPKYTIGDGAEALKLAYHKHEYSLGAHYNSVVPASL
eukprot:Clim_evm162s157 gene=Clim_evmTU162s157